MGALLRLFLYAVQHVDGIGVFRVHRGRIKAGTELYAGDAKKPFKVVHPLLLQGKNTADTDELHAGDIGALRKVVDLYYASVLHSVPVGAGTVLPRPPHPGCGKTLRSRLRQAVITTCRRGRICPPRLTPITRMCRLPTRSVQCLP